MYLVCVVIVPTVTFKELTSDFQFIFIFSILLTPCIGPQWKVVCGDTTHGVSCLAGGGEMPAGVRPVEPPLQISQWGLSSQHRCWTNLRISLNISLFCFKRLVTMVRSMQVFNAVIFHWACWYRSSCVSFNARLW